VYGLSIAWWNNSIQGYQWKPQGAASICFVFIYAFLANYGSYFKNSRLKMTTKLIQELVGLAVEKSWNFEGYIDVKYFGIKNFVCVRVFFDETDEDLRFNIELSDDDAYSKLQAAIDKVKTL
jgi:hypothetical protein